MVARADQLLPHASSVLTRRERGVLLLTAAGLTEKECARLIRISPNTVRIHVENAKRKLRASNKTHAVVIALRAGELSIEQISALDEGQHAVAAAANPGPVGNDTGGV